MIKKFFLFIFFVCFLFLINIKVNGEQLTMLPKKYVQINIGDDSLIEEDNLEIVSGVVDWNKVGNYYITYKDRLDNIYKKEFIVFQNYDNQYFINKENEKQIDVINDDEIIDIFYVSPTSYYLISNYQEKNVDNHDAEKICITYYESDKYKWEYHYYKYSRYNYGYLYNDNLIVAGLVYNENNNYINTIVLFEITPNREIIKSREIKSNASCFCNGLNIFNDEIYLITSTSGNQDDYLPFKKDNDYRFVILKLSYKSFKILDGKTDNIYSNYSAIDSSFYDSRIAINISFKENIKVNNVIYTNAIIEFTDVLEYYNCYYYSLYNKNYLGFNITLTDVCIFLVDNSINKNCITVQYLNNDVQHKQITLDLETKYNINKVQVFNINKNNIYLTLNYHKINGDYFLGFAKLNSDKGVTYYPLTPTEKSIINSTICKGIIKNIFYKNDFLCCETYNLIEILSDFYEFDDHNLIKKSVIVNGIDSINTSYIDTVNLNVYGLYFNKIILEDQFKNEFVLEEEFYLFLKSNIKHNEVYQKGQILNFNGEATLNGVVINNNFRVNEIGNYLLIIKGENNINSSISFEIKQLTVCNNDRDVDNFRIEKVENYNKVKEDTSYINNTITLENKNKYEIIIPLILSVCILCIITFLFVRKKI